MNMKIDRKVVDRLKKRILIVLAILCIIWILLPSAADATGLKEQLDHGIASIELVPRPGSGDPTIEITAQDEITEIVKWFLKTRVCPNVFFRGGGSQVAVLFNLENGDRVRVDVTEHTFFLVDGPTGTDWASVFPIIGNGFWTNKLAE